MRLALPWLTGLVATIISMAAVAQTTYAWTDVTPRASYAYVYDVAVHPLEAGRLVVIGMFDPGLHSYYTTVMLSDDAGANWRPSTFNPRPQGFNVQYDQLYSHIGRPGVLFLSRDFRALSFIGRAPDEVSFLRSDDFGITWVPGPAAREGTEQAIRPFASDPSDPNRIFGMLRSIMVCQSNFFATYGCTTPVDTAIVESRDGGVSWRDRLVGVTDRAGIADPPTPAAPRRLFFAQDDTYTILVSRDGGGTWNPFPTNTAFPLRWVKQDPRRANVLYAMERKSAVTRNRLKLLRSDDEGATWRTIFEVDDDGSEPMLTIDAVRSNELWLTGVGRGVSRSGDGGSTWSFIGGAGEYQGAQLVADTQVKVLVTAPTDPGVVYATSKGRLLRGVPSVRPDPVIVEFHYAAASRYWVATTQGEALSQDFRLAHGDVGRTGQRFGGWRADDAPANAVGVCRFWPRWGLQTRVILLQGFECDLLKNDGNWILEAEDEFFAVRPNAAGGCDAGLVPVRRFINAKPEFNHRWVTNAAIAQEMGARGWYDEGVRICARPLGSNE